MFFYTTIYNDGQNRRYGHLDEDFGVAQQPFWGMNFVHICLRNVKIALKSYLDVVYTHLYILVQCVIRSTYDNMYCVYKMSPDLVFLWYLYGVVS